MNDHSVDSTASSPIRTQRVAGLVADALRQRILNPDMANGGALPKEADLQREFRVGKPAIREALRVLESEGLVTIKRGNQGGPVARKPQGDTIAYTIGLALIAEGEHSTGVGAAVQLLEPACAMACAKRPDRERTVVPALRALIEQARSADDKAAASRLARAFHEELVRRCGNTTLSIVAGAVERLWSSHVATATERAPDGPRQDAEASAAEHERITDLIEIGDATGVFDVVAKHIERVQHSGATSQSDVPIALSVLSSRVRP